MQQIKDLSLVTLTVLLFNLSFPGGGFPWLAWFSLVPIGVALHNKTRREAFTLMASTAFFAWMIAAWWVIPGITEAASTSILVALPFAIIFCIFYAVPYGIAGMCSCYMRWTDSISGAMKSAFLWTAICYITPHILPGNIAHSQYLYPRVIQIVDIGGMPLLFFMIHWFNWLLVTALNNLKSKPFYAVKAIALAQIIPLLLLGYGEWRLNQIRDIVTKSNATIIKVGWLQPNISVKGRDRDAWKSEKTRIKFMSQHLLSKHPDLTLLIWPEIPPPISYLQWRKDKLLIDKLLANTKATLLLTGHHNQLSSTNGSENNGYYNIMEFIPTSRKIEVYQKQSLLPFAEYLPGEEHFPWLRQVFPKALYYKEGVKSRVFFLNEKVRLIPLICYEAVFPGLVRSAWQQGGNLIINPADDAWFGKTAGATVHLALAIFRTVEFRIPMIRVTNTGISALIKSSGEIDTSTITPMYEANVMAKEVKLASIKSIYAFYGNLFLWLSIIITIVSLLLGNKIKHQCQGKLMRD